MTSTPNRTHLPRWLALPLLMLLTLTCWADNNLTVSADRHQLNMGESLELQVRYDGQTTGEPDFSILEEDFEIVAQQRQNQFSILNGSTRSYTQWTLQLLPKKTGRLQIPALSFKGAKSDPISLEIQKRTDAPPGEEAVFIETELSKTSAYVQEQLLLTLRLNTSLPLQRLKSEELMVKNAALVKVAEEQYQRHINGKRYQAVELKYALFPEASGKLVIPPVRFNAVVPVRRDLRSGSFFGPRGKPIFLLSDEQQVEVKPRPASYSGTDWLPTQGLSLTERWSRPLDELVAGEPITRTIHMTAQGLMDSQLPPLNLDAGDGYKVYPDQPQLENTIDESGVMGSRVESVAIVPSRAGEIELPPITVRWWDTASQEMRKTVLKGHTLSVKPAQGMAAAPTESQQPATQSPAGTPSPAAAAPSFGPLTWGLIIANGLLLIAVLALFLLWRKDRKTAASDTRPDNGAEEKEAQRFKILCQIARGDNLHGFREALLAWASAFWQRPLFTLSEVARAANDPEVTTTLEALDRALYSPTQSEEIDLCELCARFKAVRKQRRNSASRGRALSPLYGTTEG